jgi:hypothetical protein
MDLDVLLSHEEGRHVLANIVTLGVPLGAQLLRYVGLFRPGKRALAMGRTLALLAEIWPDMQRGAINRKGRDWATTPEMWSQAIEQLLASRDKGSLTLPLTSHGYLYEVLCGLADKVEAQLERDRQADQRSRAHIAGPTALDQVLNPVIQPITAAPAPSGPSPMALKIRAEIAAKKALRAGNEGTSS